MVVMFIIFMLIPCELSSPIVAKEILRIVVDDSIHRVAIIAVTSSGRGREK